MVASWRLVAVASYVIVNVVLVATSVRLGPWTADWVTFVGVAGSANPYERNNPVPFVWSPALVPFITGIVHLGYWPWVAIHVGALALLRDWPLIRLRGVSYGFWFDVAHGNTLTFAFVAGVLALRGSKVAAIAYLAMLVLMPRPLMLPLAAWLLWRQADVLWSFAAMVVLHTSWLAASGWVLPWIEVTLSHALTSWTIGPTAVIGAWWLLAGLPLGAWLTLRGYVGWAGLVVSPYVVPQYLIWPLLDVGSRGRNLGDTERRVSGCRRQADGTGPVVLLTRGTMGP